LFINLFAKQNYTVVGTKFFSLSVAFFLLGSLISCKKEVNNKIPAVDAGVAQTIQLPVDSIKLTAVGSDADGNVIGYLWSEISGPGKATIVYTGAASTSVRDLKEGLYLFQVMVTDDEGATGLDTVSVKVNPSIIQTLLSQPHQNPNEVHIWGNSNGLDGSSPQQAEIGASAWTYLGTPFTQRGAVRFDLSSIPANAIILSARLTLYSNHDPHNGDLVNANSGVDNTLLVQRITTNWTASSVHWTTQPAVTSQDQIIIPHTNQAFLDLPDIDVTNMVKSMMVNGNYGFLIRLQTEVMYNSRIFCSSFYSDASKHPKIVIEYTK
jgi:hypothetical protein